MKIPKIFGNRIAVLIVALALFSIVIFSFLKIVDIRETGFATLNTDNYPQISEEETLNTDATGEPETNSITTNELPPKTTTTEEDLSEQSAIEKKSSNKRSSGGKKSTKPNQGNNENLNNNDNENSGNSNQENNNNDNTKPNQGNNENLNNNDNPQNIKKKLSKKPKNINIKKDGREVYEGEEFQGKVRFNLEKNNKRIANFDIDFNEDVDLSNIIADSDFELGKAYMHSTSGRLKNIDLYVPIEEGDIAVVVCSNADSYDEIYYGCGENPEITKEELLYLSGPRVDRSEDGLYFVVHGITGTGATGVNATEINSSSQIPPPPGSLEGIAGNVTEITTPEGWGKTQAWQGYFGNVSGTIMLADGADNVMYNWTLASPEGEIFASTNNSINWVHIQCFNFTATGTYHEESGTGGTTNLYGTNLTQLERQYNIKPDDGDGVDETFYLIGPDTHNTFYVNANEFSEGECWNTRINDWTGFGQNDIFEEVLMYEPTTQSIIFAALLNEDVLGFDNRTHDFEMIVLEDGHKTDTSTTTYYFYAVMY